MRQRQRLIIIMINVVYIAQFHINNILTVLYSHNIHTNAICQHMNIHETIIFIHINGILTVLCIVIRYIQIQYVHI